jgi:hypothetical protein
MTLGQVRDILRNAGRYDIYGTDEQACGLADAIDAYLAGVGEVIAGLRTNADDLDRIDVCPMLATHLRNGADKLEAAIKGVA